MIENPAACIKLGDNKKSILGSPAYQGYFIAILMTKNGLKKEEERKGKKIILSFKMQLGKDYRSYSHM